MESDVSNLILLVKTCAKCGVEKPVSKFSPNRRNRDGRGSYCHPCGAAAKTTSNAKLRARIGADAYKAIQRNKMARHRQRTGDPKGRLQQQAYRAAERLLRQNHPDEFAGLYRIERYKRGLNVD